MKRSASFVSVHATTKMLIKVCLLFLSVGVYASYAVRSSGSTTEDPLFGELDFIFPQNFVSRFPENSDFFTTKILVYLLFNLFAKYLGEHEPVKFWSKFNHNDFNRVAIDATFYEYLTKFVDGKRKHLVFDPLKSSASPEDVAMHRIGDYLDNLASVQMFSDQSETRSQTKMRYYKRNNVECVQVSVPGPAYGIPGKDFPNFCDFPKTSFTCENRVPGIYADIETGCQVFHSCWPHRIDSFLCPIGTVFNKNLLTCDLWHKSDCWSSILFNRSPFSKGKTPADAETTVVMEDETRTVSESPSTLAPESDIPEYDGTCQSLFTEPLQQHMMFPPAKCKVTYMKPSTSKLAGESSKIDRMIADLLAGDFNEMLTLLIKAAQLGSRMQGAAKLPEMKMKRQIPNLDSEVVKEATEFPLQNDVNTTSEERIYSSTTELPYDNEDIIVEESVLKETSPGKVTYTRTVTKSTLVKPSKPSEDAIKQVFNTMSATLELGSRIINEGVLPLIEKIVLDSRRKKSKS